ncbi:MULTISPECIES: PRD domain-containing protein [Virgibacillus]|uniref:PRD domain protein n=2 Tax=Virgibacillus TaxID=84406 RepID=A0A024QDK7_9BACI|nr:MULTISPECIES: PRD domain-containing protein [Virgibacillus]EQB36637.1 hypothetical protein M948_16530 [Virgibacillus sp. CM-4]MYL42471.1 PRD domain-containing protein [Virgibacillus massiliensis]GGJ42155.1 hypothetical protein GCM10007111_00450 [Virgibacillus kapii]CDQ40337.1 PRD domain protein [Virgibacillus massiliensis]
MNIHTLEDRLQILVLGDVISKQASYTTSAAFQYLVDKLKLHDLEQSEMLFTHLPSALTRIEKRETMEAPAPEIIEEIRRSTHYREAEKQVRYVEKEWGNELPQEEKEFLYMHYTNVISINKGGKEK